MKYFIIFITIFFLSGCSPKEPDTEEATIKIMKVQWTGVTIKSEVIGEIITALGYDVEINTVSVTLAFRALSSGYGHIFVGAWFPTMKEISAPFVENGYVKNLSTNMTEAKYTLAVPSFCFDRGLKHFSDIHRFKDELGKKIFGIEKGNDGNNIIEKMIKSDLFNLGDFKLESSSEAGMIAAVKKSISDQKCIVFLGWSPHPMNRSIKMNYLKGSDEKTFGANDGTSEVHTMVNSKFIETRPELKKLLKNMVFSIDFMNDVMIELHNEKIDVMKAVLRVLEDKPKILESWLKDVKTRSGKPALPVVQKHFKNLKFHH